MDLNFKVFCKHLWCALNTSLFGSSLHNHTNMLQLVFKYFAIDIREKYSDCIMHCIRHKRQENSLAGATHSELTVWYYFSVYRPSSEINEAVVSETGNTNHEHLTHEGYEESTTLQIRPATETQYREFSFAKSGAPLAEDQRSDSDCAGNVKEETGPSYQTAPHTLDSREGSLVEEVIFREKPEAGRPGAAVVELQLSLPQEGHKDTGCPAVALLGAEKPASADPDPGPSSQHDRVVLINSAPADETADPARRSSKILQVSSGRELRVIQDSGAAAAGLPRVEVILDCSDEQKTEGCRLQAAKWCVAPPGEGGQSKAPPSLVSFAVSSEGTEQGEDPRWEKDHSRPHKHRARHARKSCPGWGLLSGAGGLG